MSYMGHAAFAGCGIQEMNFGEIESVGGGLKVGWSSQNTNWGEVIAWTAGGALAGSAGGWLGAGLGAAGGGLADYVGQHFYIRAD